MTEELSARRLAELESTSIASEDRTTRRLALAAAVLLIVLLSGVVYALYTGVMSVRAPRTAVEARLSVLEAAVQQYPASGDAWREYIEALVASEQLGEATRQLEVAQQSVEELETGPVAVAELTILWATGDTTSVLERGSALYEEQVAIREAWIAERQANSNVAFFPEETKPEVLIEILAYTARAYGVQGDWELATEKLTQAISINPRAANLLVMRGDAYLRNGQYDEAREDFEAALAYIPDYEAALSGLEAVEAADE